MGAALAQDALTSGYAASHRSQVRHVYVHWAGAGTGSTGVAQLAARSHLEKRQPTGQPQDRRIGAQVFAESPLIVQGEGKADGGHVVNSERTGDRPHARGVQRSGGAARMMAEYEE